jgi:hypothetical protein
MCCLVLGVLRNNKMCYLELGMFRNRTSTVVIKESGGFRNEAHPVNKGWVYSLQSTVSHITMIQILKNDASVVLSYIFPVNISIHLDCF